MQRIEASSALLSFPGMTGAWDRPVERATRLLLGLVLFGLALATLVEADLGLDPWNVFTQGLARQIGLSLGQTTVIVSLALLLLWIPLGERPGLGTIANALIVGPVVDFGLAIIPAPDQLAGQVAYMVVAIVARRSPPASTSGPGGALAHATA